MYKVQLWSKKCSRELNLIILAWGAVSRRVRHNTHCWVQPSTRVTLRYLWQVSSLQRMPHASRLGVWRRGDGGPGHLPPDQVQGRTLDTGHISPLPLIPNDLSSSPSLSLRPRDLSLTVIPELERCDQEQEKIESCLCSKLAATVVIERW